MRRLLLYICAPALLLSGQGYAAAVDDASKARPVLRTHGFSCHGEDKQKGKLRLDTLSTGLQGDSALNLIEPDFIMPDEQLSPLSLVHPIATILQP